MFDITIKYTSKGKTPGVWIVNPDHYREVSGQTLSEVLSKFVLEVANLREDILKEEFKEQMELRGLIDDDIPF